MKGEDFPARAAALTGDRMPAVVSAFVTLVERSWPDPAVVRAFARAERESDVDHACHALLAALDVAYVEFPTAMFWWKDERSTFLGFCPRFAAASGVAAFDLLGRTDADPAVVWNRQAAVYMRDDRDVLLSRVPRFDIVERRGLAGAEDRVAPHESKVRCTTAGASGAGTARRVRHDLGVARGRARAQAPLSADRRRRSHRGS